VVFISAQTRENFDELRNLVYKLVRERHFQIYPNWLDIPLTDYVEEGDGYGLDGATVAA
jgi:GTPase